MQQHKNERPPKAVGSSEPKSGEATTAVSCRRTFVASLFAAHPWVIACTQPQSTPVQSPSPAPPPGAALPPAVSDVRMFGAVGDGKTDCSEALRRAIAEVKTRGGGTLLFPPGTYLTGPLHLESNLTLRLEAGAVLSFSQDFEHYLPMVPARWEGTMVHTFSPLLYGRSVHDVTIEGEGVLQGNGGSWWKFFDDLKAGKDATGSWDTSSKWQQEFFRNNQGLEMPDDPDRLQMGFLRPPFFQLLDSKNITIRGVTFRDSPFWTINPVFCENITVDGITIENPETGPNTDGINPESCRNVHIANCHIDVGDDCITIKSGRDAEGRRIGRPAENYTITNCTMLRGHGGVVIGSEMSGGVRRIVISNCIFDGTDRGIRLKSTRGRGGVVEDVSVSNVVMKDIRIHAVTLNLFYTDAPAEPVSERTPVFRNIHFSGIRGTAKQAAMLLGLPEGPVENISFSDIELRAEQGMSIKDARDVRLRDVHIDTEAGPSLSVEGISGLDVFALSSNTPHEEHPVISLKDASGVFIHGCSMQRQHARFVHISGSSNQIVIQGNQLGAATSPVTRDRAVPPSAIQTDEKVRQQ